MCSDAGEAKGRLVMADTETSEVVMINLRRRRMEVLVGAIMEEMRHAIPSEFLEDVHHALADVLFKNGAYIMTDADRSEFGLEPRDELGWTVSERVQAKRNMDITRLQMMDFIIAKQDGE
jgi:hypothetical protein